MTEILLENYEKTKRYFTKSEKFSIKPPNKCLWRPKHSLLLSYPVTHSLTMGDTSLLKARLPTFGISGQFSWLSSPVPSFLSLRIFFSFCSVPKHWRAPVALRNSPSAPDEYLSAFLPSPMLRRFEIVYKRYLICLSLFFCLPSSKILL